MKSIKNENIIVILIIWLVILSCSIGYIFIQKEETTEQSNTDAIAELSISIVDLVELLQSDHERINLVGDKVNEHSEAFGILTKQVLNQGEVIKTHENMWNVIINQ